VEEKKKQILDEVLVLALIAQNTTRNREDNARMPPEKDR
jgi:hypothetical protein